MSWREGSKFVHGLARRILVHLETKPVQQFQITSARFNAAGSRHLTTHVGRGVGDLRQHHATLTTRLHDFSNLVMGKMMSSQTGERRKADEDTPLEVHVTHFDPTQDAAPGDDSARSVTEDGAVDSGDKPTAEEPVQVRFLDVPGSEETRAEKMTIVFTCKVRVREVTGSSCWVRTSCFACCSISAVSTVALFQGGLYLSTQPRITVVVLMRGHQAHRHAQVYTESKLRERSLRYVDKRQYSLRNDPRCLVYAPNAHLRLTVIPHYSVSPSRSLRTVETKRLVTRSAADGNRLAISDAKRLAARAL